MFCIKAVLNKIFCNYQFTRMLMEGFLLYFPTEAGYGTPENREGKTFLHKSKRLF